MSLEHPSTAKIEKETSFEVMSVPEIVIREERGLQLCSALFKAHNPAWGETETPLAKEAADYFRTHPLDPKVSAALESLEKENVDEETLSNIALTYEHSERVEGFLAMATEYKQHVQNPEEKLAAFTNILHAFDQIFQSSPLAEKIAVDIKYDEHERLERIDAARRRIETIIDFFKPDGKTSNIRTVTFIPTDPLNRANTGRAFHIIPGEQMIASNIDNTLNQDHEFSHGLVNPIVDKLADRLTNEQKQTVSKMAKEGLKRDYGANYYSLLCEEFIRTYTELIAQNKQPETSDDFSRKIANINENQFDDELARSESFKTSCAEMGIQSAADFKNKSKEFFERHKENPLRNLVFKLYREYIDRPDKENENFERFILEKLPKSI